MNNYILPSENDISKVLRKLTEEKIAAVLERLKELGVDDKAYLIHVTEKDLTDENLLKQVQARRLVKSWRGIFLSLKSIF